MFKYDIIKAEEVMHHFYTVTKIRTTLFDSNFTAIAMVPYGKLSFCVAMCNVTESHEECKKCSHYGLQMCRNKNKNVIYRCHAGLIEAITPVRIGDITVGYIMLGQILQENADIENIIKYSSQYIGDKANSLLSELKPCNDEEINSAIRLMEGCVCYLLMNNFIQKENGSVLLELCHYIEENPAADLSVNALCERFKISRNHLYKLSNTYLGMPVADYVRTKRLKYAEKLIKEGCSVTEAAELAGFYDYGYFGKIFKKHTGKTPSKAKYR